MVSTSITTVGGVVIVTHILPQAENGDTSILLQTAAKPPAPPTAPGLSITLSPPPPGPASPCTRAELQGLGVVQIFVGLLCVLFSLTSVCSSFLIIHAPLCAGVAFVLSGSLSLAVSRRSSVPLISVTLASNVLSVLLGLMGVAYLCWLLADRSAPQRLCDIKDVDQYQNARDDRRRCVQMVWTLNIILDGLRGFLLLLVLLQVCVSVAVCVLSVKTIRRRDHHAAVTVLGVDVHPPSVSCRDVALLDSVDKDTVSM